MSLFDRLATFATQLMSNQQIGTDRLSAADLAYAERSEQVIPAATDAARVLYRNYYAGTQRQPDDLSATAAWEPRHNVCGLIVDVLLERLAVRGFVATGDALTPDQAKTLTTEVWRWWQGGRMDEGQISTHAGALIDGDSFVLVDFDAANNRPRFTVNDALLITPVYDDAHQMIAAYKTWTQTVIDDQNRIVRRPRITKYTPALIEKFAFVDNAWVLWTEDTDAEGAKDNGVIAWTDDDGAPLGIPLVHMRNRPRGGDFGRSELADVVPMQDQYNARVWAASEGIQYSGSPQKYVSNVQPPRDSSNRETSFLAGPGTILTLNPINPASGVTVGQWQPGDVAQLQEAADRELKTIAGLTGTPAHLIWPEGGLPSGEALKTAEARLVAKLQDRAVTFGNTWEDVAKLAVRLWNVFGDGEQLPDPSTFALSAQWGPFETRSELADAQRATLLEPLVGERESLRIAGYDDEQRIDTILEEKAASTPPALQLADQFAGQLQSDQQQGQQG